HDIGLGDHGARLSRRPKEGQLVGFQGRRVLLEHNKGLPELLERAQKRYERADNDDLVGGADLSRVKSVDPDPQLRFRVWPAPPAGIGQRIQRGDAEPAAEPVRAERFAGKSGCRTAAKVARRTPSRHGASAAKGFANRLDRRCAGAEKAAFRLHAGEEHADPSPLDGDAVEVWPKDFADRLDGVVKY